MKGRKLYFSAYGLVITPHIFLQKHALFTDFYIGIRIYTQLCRQASISDAAPFLRSVGPMGPQDASPHSRNCGEDSFMARVGCRVSLPRGGARGSGLWFGVIWTLPGSCRPTWELV